MGTRFCASEARRGESLPQQINGQDARGPTAKMAVLRLAGARPPGIDAGELARLLCGRCSGLRRRWGRSHVLFDQIPKGGREEERDDLRLPVFQNQFLHHKSSAAKSRRCVCEMFPG